MASDTSPHLLAILPLGWLGTDFLYLLILAAEVNISLYRVNILKIVFRQRKLDSP